MASLTSRLPNLSRDNISLYLLPALWFLGVAGPKIIGRNLYMQATGGRKADVVNPRSFSETVAKDPSIDEATKKRIIRTECAVTNHHENFPIFVGALVAGNAAGLSPKVLNGLTLGYMATRFVHSAIYIWHDTVPQAVLRPIAFFASAGMWITLLVKSAKKFNEAAVGR